VPTVEHKIPTLENAFGGITTHIKKHKSLYAFGGGFVLAGALIVLTNRTTVTVNITPEFYHG